MITVSLTETKDYVVYNGDGQVGKISRGEKGFIFKGDDGWSVGPTSMVEMKAIVGDLYLTESRSLKTHFTLGEAIKLTCKSHTSVYRLINEIRTFHRYLPKQRFGDFIVHHHFLMLRHWDKKHGRIGYDFLEMNPQVSEGIKEMDYSHYEQTGEIRYL